MRIRTSRSAAIVTVAGILLLAGCQPRDGRATARQATTTPAPPTEAISAPAPSTEPALSLTPSEPPHDPGSSGLEGMMGDLEETAGIDACALLTVDEIEDALGQPFEVEQIIDVPACDYASTDPLDLTSLTLVVTAPINIQPELFSQQVEGVVDPGYRVERIDGPGDATVLATTSADGTQIAFLHVLTGDTWLDMSLIHSSSADAAAESLTQLADAAVQRLP